MNFVVIIVALLLLQWWGSGAPVQRDGWFRSLWRALDRRLSPPWALSLAVVTPALVVGVLCLALATLWLGVPLFLLELLVLLYSLGRGDLRQQLESYLQRWRRGDQEAAYYQARQLTGGEPLRAVEQAEDLHTVVRRALLYRGLERWFTVVFWFALGGPAAALVYRLLQLAGADAESRPASHALARAVLAIADWVPARLLGLSFALVGHFAETFQVWRRDLWQTRPIAELLEDYQQAAQQVPLASGESISGGDRELSELMALLTRSVVLWVVVLAVLQLL